jgi:hypothetical protein
MDANPADLEVGPDWTASGANTLVVHFRGDAGNSPTINDRMWVELEDTNSNAALVLYDGDANDLMEGWWHEWNIGLFLFDVCGVDLTDVGSISIGFGGYERTGQTADGGTGYVLFDDIRLYGGGGVTPGLIAHWKFDEVAGVTAYDSAGSSHGTLINGPIWGSGQIDGALEFDGIDDYVSCGTGPAITGTGPFSVSAWVKTDSSKGQAVLVQRSESSANGSYGLSILADGRAQSHTYNGGYGVLFQSDVTVNDGLWHHIAVVRTNSTDGEIYVDGSLSGSDSGPARSLNNVPVWIGGPGFTGPFDFEGSIDDVRIYDRALSAEAVEQLYQDGL